MNRKKIQLILNKLNINPSRLRGQNFLVDNNIREKIVKIAEINENDYILEVGPGLGFLTELLVEKAKKVYAIEIENKFSDYLKNKFEKYDNFEIINADILKIKLPPHNKVVSNLPFSSTGPIIEKLFFKENPPEGTLILEKKIAKRIIPDNGYKNISRITIGANSFFKTLKLINISKNSFYPVPKIDLALIKIAPLQNINPFLKNEKTRKFFLKFIAGVMPYKNKNLSNALILFLKREYGRSFNNEIIDNIINISGFGSKKLFTYKINDFIEIAKLLYDYLQTNISIT
ncbi:MAG: 16S rRNA (adenine(1518)-N(6)/adenine(1519)-N(6))-dimethyltransferase RsmA [Promethearchaeia archaeon]